MGHRKIQQVYGVKPYHLMIGDALGLDHAWDEVPSVHKNAKRTSTLEHGFHVARKIIQHEATCNPEILAATVRRALAHVTDRERVVVRVNPVELQRALQLKEDLLYTVEGLRHLGIEGDEAVRPGGCLVDSTCGEINARLEVQCEELEQRFREHYRLMSEANVS